MKAKYYIGILSVLMLSGMPVKAQFSDGTYYGNDGTRIIVNNYYADCDYYYSSRINRFHRSYAAFEYYSPVFTDTYWYTYTPFSWGISIYSGGLGFSVGYNFNYPVYYTNTYYYDNGWYDPFYYRYNYWNYRPHFYNSFYWGYDPFFYSYWNTPFIVNYNYGWPHNYYGWNIHHHNHYYRWNDHRPVYYSNKDNGHSDYRPALHSARNENTNSVSRRQSSEINNRQGSIAEVGRRSSASRSSTAAAPVKTNASKQVTGNQNPSRSSVSISQPENRRNANQPSTKSKNMEFQASVNRSIYKPSQRNEAITNQPDNRRNISQTASASTNMKPLAARNEPASRTQARSANSHPEVSAPSRRESSMSQNRSSSVQEPKSSDEGRVRSEDSGRRK